jgi:hypothetical protein
MGEGDRHITLLRMVHIDNVPHILEHGITHRDSSAANSDYAQIGDRSLITTRSTLKVDVNNGDLFAMDTTTICLGDYIPFYFGSRMPMLYVMQKGGNFVKAPIDPSDIIYIVTSVQLIANAGLVFYFSDGHPVDKGIGIYESSYVSSIEDLLDFDAIKEEYWGGEDNIKVKRKKQAEFLVGSNLPVDLIRGYVC